MRSVLSCLPQQKLHTVQTEDEWSDLLIKPKSLYCCHIATKWIQVWHGKAKQVWLVCAAQIQQRKTLALPWIIKCCSWWRWFSFQSRSIPPFNSVTESYHREWMNLHHSGLILKDLWWREGHRTKTRGASRNSAGSLMLLQQITAAKALTNTIQAHLMWLRWFINALQIYFFNRILQHLPP